MDLRICQFWGEKLNRCNENSAGKIFFEGHRLYNWYLSRTYNICTFILAKCGRKHFAGVFQDAEVMPAILSGVLV